MSAKGGTGSLLDAIKAAAHVAHGATCTAGVLMESMSPQDQADINTALADKSIPATVIAKVLTERGYRLSHEALQRHRRGACACGRTS